MKKSLLAKLLFILVTTATLSGCIWPWWVEEDHHHHGGYYEERHEHGEHEGGEHR